MPDKSGLHADNLLYPGMSIPESQRFKLQLECCLQKRILGSSAAKNAETEKYLEGIGGNFGGGAGGAEGGALDGVFARGCASFVAGFGEGLLGGSGGRGGGGGAFRAKGLTACFLPASSDCVYLQSYLHYKAKGHAIDQGI